MTYLRGLSKAAKLTALAVLVVAGGAVGGVLATSGHSPASKVALVQRSDATTPTTTVTSTTAAPTPTTTMPPTTSAPATSSPAPAPDTATTLTPDQAAASANQSAQAAAASAGQAAASAQQAQAAAPSVPTTAPGSVAVPDIAGMAWNDGVSAIHAAGLVVAWSSACPVDPIHSEPLTGSVPSAGTMVPVGSTVDFCS